LGGLIAPASLGDRHGQSSAPGMREVSMSFGKRLIVILIVLISCVSCDQATKSIAKSVLSESEARSYFAGTVRLQLAYNDGAFLSMGSSLPQGWREIIFIIGDGVLLLGILAFALISRPGSITGVLAVALIFSGGLSNLLDRAVYCGTVVDFLNIGIGSVRSGIFNVADMAITVGVILIIFTKACAGFKERI
jgi:signal peptidase II